MKKCKYFNDYQTPVTLMIDDLSFTALSLDGKLHPYNDWGYGLNRSDSLYEYLGTTLFCKYPEVKGAFFVPLHKHAVQNNNSGYQILFNDDEESIAYFIQQISDKFELAFHGLQHGRYKNIQNCSIVNNWEQEFSYFVLEDINILKLEIELFEQKYGVKFYGGKYPGYVKNTQSEEIIESLGFKWWASDCNMINKKSIDNIYAYFGLNGKILDMPTNLSGDIFKYKLGSSYGFHSFASRIKGKLREIKAEMYLEYLYNSHYIISVQEHFQNLRTDGKRQTPNVYDDLLSLDRIFGILRGADIWYATCSNIAHYIDSYDHTDVVQTEKGNWRIKYNGHWDTIFLTVKSKNKYLKDLMRNQIIQGIYKQGYWIFNDIQQGEYQEL